ncbi:MAG: hypothetical protein EXQ87_01445 [Alphaproteobacteria bacterium]|nr:hypothetical protein [Alphaproteobacteria bacterium]
MAGFLGRELSERDGNGRLLKTGFCLLPTAGERPFTFRFACCGIAVEAETVAVDGTTWIQFDALQGHVPFSAANPPTSSTRRAMLSHIRRRHGVLTSDGRSISARRRIEAPVPLNPVGLVATAAAFMAELAPEIAALAEYLPPRRPESRPSLVAGLN